MSSHNEMLFLRAWVWALDNTDCPSLFIFGAGTIVGCQLAFGHEVMGYPDFSPFNEAESQMPRRERE